MKKSKKFMKFMAIGTIVPLASLTTSCFGPIFEPHQPPNPNPNPNPNPSGGESTDWSDVDGYVHYDAEKNPKDFLKKDNQYYFAQVLHNEQKYDADVYRNDNWKKNEYMPKINVRLDLDKDWYTSQPELSEIKDLFDVDYSAPVKLNNMMRNFLNPEYKDLGLVDSKNYINSMASYLGGSQKDVFAYKDSYHGNKWVFEDQKEVREYYHYYFDMKLDNYYEQFINDFALKGTSKEFKNIAIDGLYKKGMWNNYFDLGKDYSKWFYLAFTRSNVEKYHEGFKIYETAKQNKDFIMQLPTGDDYNLWNDLSSFAWMAGKMVKLTLVNNEAYKKYLELLQMFGTIQAGNKKWFEIEQVYRNYFKEYLDKATNALLDVLKYGAVFGVEMEELGKEKKTLVKMFPVAIGDNQFADYEYSYVWAYRTLYDVLMPMYGANDWEVPYDFTEYDNQKSGNTRYAPIYEYINFFTNTVFKAKDKSFKELELNTNFMNKMQEAEYKKEAKSKFHSWIAIWNNRVNGSLDTSTLD